MKSEARRAWAAFIEQEVGILHPFRNIPTRDKNLGRHGNRTTVVDGIKFTSQLEADRYRELKLLRASGEVLWFLRQVPFDVATGVVYRADFLVVWNRTGSPQEIVTIEDTKGHLTDTSRVKIAAVEDRYGIKVRLLRRGDVSR